MEQEISQDLNKGLSQDPEKEAVPEVLEEPKKWVSSEELEKQGLPSKKKRTKYIRVGKGYRLRKAPGKRNWPQQQKERPLTAKELAVVEAKLRGGKTNVEIGLKVFNTMKPSGASAMVWSTLRRPEVINHIERRLAAQDILVNDHLKNVDQLAFKAEKEDVRLRASQDILDRAGTHYKYYADDGKVSVDVQITDEQFKDILTKYKPLTPIEGEVIEQKQKEDNYENIQEDTKEGS